MRVYPSQLSFHGHSRLGLSRLTSQYNWSIAKRSFTHVVSMVIGLLILTSIPAVTGVSLAISGQKEEKERQKDATRMKKFNIDVHCDTQSPRSKEVHAHRLVLKDDRVWIGPVEALNPCTVGYVAESFYIEYPDNEVRHVCS